MRKVIRGGTVVTAADAVLADVLIDGEKVVAVGSFGDVDAEPIRAPGASCCRARSTTTRTCPC